MDATHENHADDQDQPRWREAGLLREVDIIGDRRRGIPGLIPCSRSHWRKGVRDGRFPAPVKVPNGNMAFWQRAAILDLIDRIVSGGSRK